MANVAIKPGDIVRCEHRGRWLVVDRKSGQEIKGHSLLHNRPLSTYSRRVSRVFRQRKGGCKAGDLIYCPESQAWLFVTEKTGQQLKVATLAYSEAASTTARQIGRLFRELGRRGK